MILLDRYINWDKAAIEMIRRHQDAIYALDALRDEKDALNANIGNIGAMDYERPRVASSGGDAQDTIVNRLLRMDTIDTRIQALEREMQAYDRAWSQLSETERAVLHEFFQCGNRPSQRAVEILCEECGYESRKIYNMRRDAVKHFKFLLVS